MRPSFQGKLQPIQHQPTCVTRAWWALVRSATSLLLGDTEESGEVPVISSDCGERTG